MRSFNRVFAVSLVLRAAAAQTLSSAQINRVKERLREGATHSWELGTRSAALLDLDAPSYSVFTGSIPPSQSAPSDGPLSEIFNISRTVLAHRTAMSDAETLWTGDGAAGDPASCGPAVLLSAWTGQEGANYTDAAASEVRYLLDDVPRTADGAISHRAAQVQLWSDSVFMVPPFLAYYGALMGDRATFDEAYTQIQMYRKYLHDATAGGLWRHIVLGSARDGEPGTDAGHWSTGNAWAAAGMARVLATYNRSTWGEETQSEQAHIKQWMAEIHAGMYALQDESGIFHNYPDETSTFLDAASATLLAASVYRLAALTGDETYVPQAEVTRLAVLSGAQLDGQGWLTPVVNPDNYPAEGEHSPEAQAFVLELQAAYKQWAGL